MKGLKIKVDDKIKFNKPLVVLGFQGVGLVGTIAAQYLATTMGMKKVGYIHSSELPPLALLIDSEITHPIRIYTNNTHDLIIVESELPIPKKLAYEISDELVKFAGKVKAKEIICLEGIASLDGDEISDVYLMRTTEKKFKNKVKELRNGIIIGLSASVLLKCLEGRVTATCLMAESRDGIPDGLAAASVLEKFGELYKIPVDTASLKKQSAEFEKKLGRVISQARKLSKTEAGIKPPSHEAIYG